MKLTCPFCSGKFILEEGVRTKIMIELAEVGARLNKSWLLAWEYSDAFANQKHGTVTPAKRLRLFKELAKLWDACMFEFDGKRYKTSQSKIMAALRTVCDAEKFGFRNHNYLKRVLVADAERVSAEGLTAREERGREEDKKVGRLEGWKVDETLSPEAQRELKKKLGVSKFSELIGKNIKKGSKVQGSEVEGLKNGTTEIKRPQDGAGSAGV